MKQPTGYEIDNNKVCKLRKAISGLHQSGRQWFLELENKLIKLKFKKLEWVNCVYMFGDNVILLFYEDDMIIFGKEMENVNFILQLLQKNFDLKIMGKTKKLLGIEFEEIGNSLFIHQRSYIRRLCEIYEKYKYNVSSLPISKGQVLSKLDSPKTSEEILTVPYRNLIGSLSFIAIRTRPDIMYAINVLSQFQANPGIKHWNCLLRLLGYLKYTQEYKLELSKVKSLKLRCYSDSDFATNRDDRVSMGGFITFIDETPIIWRTFKQKSVSLSTMEAEYVSLTEAAKEFIWLKNLSGPDIRSWLVCHEFEPSTTKDSPCRTTMHVKYVEAQTSSRCVGVVWKLGEVGISSGVVLLLDQSSKYEVLRGPPPKAHV
ncbi:retrovirus-related Pol polyprotein from transposon TNT 1-94 [Trichonephila clavipes]|nr:retrovirus-related Pol polyprotein from transposon TNT 1-94 [Trichonephila clavipes]